MAADNETKMGLTEEDARHRDEGPGRAGLPAAMGDSEADAAQVS